MTMKAIHKHSGLVAQATSSEYFLHNTDMRNGPKIRALRRKFGSEGYAIWCMLLERLTDTPADKLQYVSELDRELLAGDFGIEPDTLDAMIQYMVKVVLLKNVGGELSCAEYIERGVQHG
jgi:hypothetical protein